MLTSVESDRAFLHIVDTCQEVKKIVGGEYMHVPQGLLEEYLRILELKRFAWSRENRGDVLPPTVIALWDNLHLQILDLAIAMGRDHLKGLKRVVEDALKTGEK